MVYYYMLAAASVKASMGSLPNLHELKHQLYSSRLDGDQSVGITSQGSTAPGVGMGAGPGAANVPPHRPLTATLSESLNRSSQVRPTASQAAYLADFLQHNQIPQQGGVYTATFGYSPTTVRVAGGSLHHHFSYHHPPHFHQRMGAAVRGHLGHTRQSSGGHWDDATIEQHMSYSPLPSRSSARCLAASGAGTASGQNPQIPQLSQHSTRRKDSLSSSAGASSVRRLIAVVRSTPSRLGPVYTRRTLCRNFAALCLGHAMLTVALVPLLALQSSVSAWWWTSAEPHAAAHNPNSDAGSLLLAAFFATAALSSLISPAVVAKLGPNWTLIAGYFQVSAFFAAHLYPTIYTLVPTYLMAGLWLGPLAVARITCLMTLASKFAFVLTEQEEIDADAEELEAVMAGAGGGGRTETVLRRLARGMQAAHDLGLVFGSLLSAMLLWYTLPGSDVIFDTFGSGGERSGALTSSNVTIESALSQSGIRQFAGTNGDIQDVLLPTTALLDNMFSSDETTGERICGANACPVTVVPFKTFLASPFNAFLEANVADTTTQSNWSGGSLMSEGKLIVLPCKTTAVLASVFLGCSIMGLALTAAFLDRIRHVVQQDPLERSLTLTGLKSVMAAFKDPRLQLITPLSVFIGLEQGFMYADFSKWYVVCSLGIPNVSLVFLSMGALQSVAACTLSMLLQHIRRYIVIAVGFVFHSCLILVLLLWIPSAEDAALFYVISAAWGVCNAIWETLSFTLLVRVYPDNWQPPFSHCHLFRCLGLSLSLLLHGAACNWLKLYALFGALLLAVAPYTWLEVRLDSRRRAKHPSSSAPL